MNNLHEILAARLQRPELLRDFLVPADHPNALPVIDPATRVKLCHVCVASESDAHRALDLASAAFPDWKKRGPADRARILRAFADKIAANLEDLAVIMTAEQGKPLLDARGEVAHGLEYVRWYAEEARRAYGEHLRLEHGQMLTQKEPVGVVAAITPWNFPNSTVLRKIAPALAAGCPVLAKPANQTPLSALALQKIWQEAGGPEGAMQILAGQGAVIGSVLTRDSRVRALSFTGSTETGKGLMRACAATVKRLSLELGGHAPFIVFADADLDAAVAGVVACKFRNSGQTCVSANRLMVQEEIANVFLARLTRKLAALKSGNGFQSGVDLGPLIDGAALVKIERHVADAQEQGAEILCGGARLSIPENPGAFFAPTLILRARQTMLAAREESFGPILPVFTFKTEREAILLANATEYGLAAYFYSTNAARCRRVAEQLAFGMVGVNTGRMSAESTPFGGVKQSGFGREGGKYGMDEFLEVKMIRFG